VAVDGLLRMPPQSHFISPAISRNALLPAHGCLRGRPLICLSPCPSDRAVASREYTEDGWEPKEQTSDEEVA
jgi:hypothetical protein